MESNHKDGSSVSSSPISSPNISNLLKIKVLSWSKKTGLPASLCVRVCNKTFNLHSSLLFTKSGYFKKRNDQLQEEIEIQSEFPGGVETFEKIMLFIYGCSTLVDAFNITQLRCAAEFLEMGNLCERFDLYLNQVVLQNWDDTLIVLKICQDLLPWSEDLLIVSRCIESLAFTACMEILDPERQTNQDIWIKDLTDLPFEFFKQVIESLRRQGMNERYVSPLIVFYTKGKTDSDHILQRALDLLFTRDKPCRFVPIGFYLACLEHALRDETLLKLQYQIVSLLHTAHIENFLYPKAENGEIGSSKELLIMESLFLAYDFTSSTVRSMRVGKLWDIYLSRLPYDQEMKTSRFIELIEIIPMSFRESHDELYLSVDAFLQVHEVLSPEEKGSICSYLNCQKLSQEMSLKLVQNEHMPLRLVVQALFIQQLNTHQAFKDFSDSFRFTNSRPLTSQQSPCTDDEVGQRSRSLCFLMQKDTTLEDYESTSFRIHDLEEEIVSLKKTILAHKSIKEPTCIEKRSVSKNRNPFEHLRGACIGSVNFSSQRKYANRLLGVLRKVNLFGNRKTNRNECGSEDNKCKKNFHEPNYG